MAKKGFEWAGEMQKKFASEEYVSKAYPIITISRQHGSGGRQIGRKLASELNIKLYDHEIIELAAESSSLDKTSFAASDTDGYNDLMYDLSSNVHHSLTLSDKAFLHQAEVIRKVAQNESCVIVGRCADYVLKDYKNVIKVFIYGDLKEREYRIKNVYNEIDVDPAKKIEQKDNERSSYYNHYTGKKFGDMINYDICLNSSVIGIDGFVDIIKDLYLKHQDNNE